MQKDGRGDADADEDEDDEDDHKKIIMLMVITAAAAAPYTLRVGVFYNALAKNKRASAHVMLRFLLALIVPLANLRRVVQPLFLSRVTPQHLCTINATRQTEW